jgi:endoglucanase
VKKLLQTLTEAFGPSGYEDEVRRIVGSEAQSLADEIQVDALGNLIVHKHPGRVAGGAKRIMIAAHMDEIGLIASHVDEKGFIRFSPLGPVVISSILGGRVRFLNGIRGLVGFDPAKPVNELLALEQVYIDVGAKDRQDCPVKIGDVAAFDRPFTDLGNRLVAKSMNNRVGVLVAIETLRALKSTFHDIYFVFTTQHEVGGRGALTSAYGVDPEIGIALDVTRAGDTPNTHGMDVALGGGPCIKIQDASSIADPRMVAWMIRAAEKDKVPYQREVLRTGGTDAGVIQLARAGVPSGGISVPVRYVHSPSEMVDYSDVQNAVRLLAAMLRTPIDL